MMNSAQISFFTDAQQEAEQNIRRLSNAYAAKLCETAAIKGHFDTETNSRAEQLAAILAIAGTTRTADPFETAERLIDTFGSVKGVLEARREQLANVEGMTPARVRLIRLVLPLVRLWNEEAMTTPDKIGNSREAEAYCLSILAGERVEKFYVTALNARCQILGRRCIATGSLSEVNAYPRLVTETALNFNAHSILLSHNHPGGTCAPSQEDITSTQRLQRVLGDLGILVLDHIIVAGDRSYSMIQHGDIDYRIKAQR